MDMDRVRSLIGVTRINRGDLYDLPEYSCTIPTRATIGYRWRCAVNGAGRHDQHNTEWLIQTYVADPAGKAVALIHTSWAVDMGGEPWIGDLR